MKTAIIVAFACCFALALTEAKNCQSGDDCGDDECCMRISAFITPKCKKLRQKDEFCFPRKEMHEDEKTYRFMCPCVEGLECKAAEVDEKDGVVTFKQAKCVEP